MTLGALLDQLGTWFKEAARTLAMPDQVANLQERVRQLEARHQIQVDKSESSNLAEYTHDPRTWPTRNAKASTPFPQRGEKEYDSDGVDLKIAMAILRREPDRWNDLRKDIAQRRRLTPQQVAELKARITRHGLLKAA